MIEFTLGICLSAIASADADQPVLAVEQEGTGLAVDLGLADRGSFDAGAVSHPGQQGAGYAAATVQRPARAGTLPPPSPCSSTSWAMPSRPVTPHPRRWGSSSPPTTRPRREP
jgi:hypothetical protein